MDNVEAKPVVDAKRVPPKNLKGEALENWKQIEALKAKNKELSKKDAEANKVKRLIEMKAHWVIFRGFVRLLKSGNADIIKALDIIEASMQPHEGYTADHIKEDKTILKAWKEDIKQK